MKEGTVLFLFREDLLRQYKNLEMKNIEIQHFTDKHFKSILEKVFKSTMVIFKEDVGSETKILKCRY